MVLLAVKHLEKSTRISSNDMDNVSILGLDQGCILLFAATTLSRNSSTPRSIIGGVDLIGGDQKIYHRHPSCVKITHASINASRSLCCFVTRSESYAFDVFVAEIGSSNSGRLFSLKFPRSSSIRAYFAPNDVILLLNRDVVTLFRMPNSGNALDKAYVVDRDAQISNCIYYQWDTIQQRLHVIQTRQPGLIKATSTTEFDALVYKAYTINARGQFDNIMKIDFDFKVPEPASSQLIFEILSSETSLFLCWQSTMKEESQKVEYAVVSLGHGRSLYLSKSLQQGHWEIFQSRRVHFGLIDGDYVFAALRGEFIHLLNFNVQLNFLNHLFIPYDSNSLPYDTKYTTQRGLFTKTSTLLYEKRNISTYTIKINPDELIRTLSPVTVESIIAYGVVAANNNAIVAEILHHILFVMYNDLNTKAYIKEILTALIFTRLSKRIHHNKYVLAFPATTVSQRHINNPEVSILSFAHHRDNGPQHTGITNIDKEYHDKLRSSFDLARKYRHKLSYYHPIMTNMEENDIVAATSATLPERGSPGTGRFSFGMKRSTLPPTPDRNINEHSKSFILLDAKNKYLFNGVSREIQQLHPTWEQGRVKELAFEYVQATQSQCNGLIELFTGLANFKRTQGLIDTENSSEKYKSLLVVIEKLYLAMDELGFSPTEELKRTLLDLSYRVMPFDRFVSAIDQNILILTEEFVTRVILELDDEPKSYTIKEQLIFMLPNTNGDLHARLFALIKTDRAQRMTAQLLVARNFSADNKSRTSTANCASTLSSEMDEIMDINSNQDNTIHAHSRLVEQAVVTFFRDCTQRGKTYSLICKREKIKTKQKHHQQSNTITFVGILDEDEMSLVKTGLFSLASSAP
ncbi:unnamed protein product [Rotaria magnacalcarata]|uniref:Gamma-secretase-activating protein C-terminal domain-containing protein n=4 Tax=Rotaria magnacalcarata TaxID=392030 RepID=A0A819GR56_9BILA|nr:unnamed protein product [Rotaria magnacalcarata]CAF3890594.1 unnamed protein product [Rotaria magnacalcarata]